MYRTAVFTGSRINAILNFEPLDRDFVLVPPELSDFSDKDLITKFEIKDGNIQKKGTEVKKPKVALVSDWGINCGIATYSKYLADALKPLVGELLILAEEAEGAVEEPNVIRCWNRKGDYLRIIEEADKFNPDLIIIQHEFGLFHKINLWQSLMSQLSRWRVLTTFHTVLEHRVPNIDASLDYKARCFAEMACPEIVVHQKKARDTLRDRGYSGRVHYIPHGCFSPNNTRKLKPDKYGMYPDQTIFQYGFGGRHKGWEFAIDTVEILKEKYPEILYLGVFNLPVGGEVHASNYHQELVERVRSKGLTKNVSLISGFQSETMLRNIISGVKVGFFPYQSPKNWFSWGASGAVQLPLSMGLPLVLGDFSQFEDYRGRIPLVKTSQEAAQEIDKLFSDIEYWRKRSEGSVALSEERSWSKVAAWYLECTRNDDFDAL
jgi:glycosyltransferase involved in cell wall biosynthesis